MNTTLTLGFSPCPNDTFIFDALVNRKIDTGGLQIEPVLEDVQTLNEWAQVGKLAITKVSYGVLPLILQQYLLLSAGGALGKGVGPLLVEKKQKVQGSKFGGETLKSILDKREHRNDALSNVVVAIPGANTTAHMLFSMAYPEVKNKQFMIFSAIEDAVLQGKADAGVIIHENRFTYQQKGLSKITDLGEYWEQQTRLPIPLGGIVIKKTFPVAIQQQVNKLIKKSVEYAFERYPFITDYVKQHSQEMEEQVMRQHIDLYVNDYSVDVGAVGKKAVLKMLEVYHSLHGAATLQEDIFITED
jgi:1,4-dihydroxy-6-naphthoate synthase